MSKKRKNSKSEMIDSRTKQIPLISAECEATRQHKIIMYLIYTVMILTVLFFGSTLAWICCEVGK